MDYYDFKIEKRFREAEDFGDFDWDKQPSRRKQPANIDEKPSGTRKVIPFDRSSKAPIPKIETRTPRDFSPKVPFSRIFNHPLFSILAPTQLADPNYDEYDWRNYKEDVSRQIAENNFVGRDLATRKLNLVDYEVDLPTLPVVNPNFVRPEVPEVLWRDRPSSGPYIARSPKIGTVEYAVPDFNVPAPIPVELPEIHPWFDPPTEEELPGLLETFDYETQPMYDPESIKALRPDTLKDTGISIDITAGDNPKVKIRPMTIRAATKRTNDTKAASRWIKLSQLAISLTYGTYTEVMDFVDILVWDAYYVDPRTGMLRYAMHMENQNIINVLNGIAEGKYSVDIAATLVDYGVSQAQDILIGKASQAITRQVVDTGNWRSPQGPQGFINKMQKDYRNVLSQYEKKSDDEQSRRLFSLPPLSESSRRLWNAKSGL